MKMLNVFGAGLCDDSGFVGCSLLHHAGLSESMFGKTPSVRTLHGHMMCEAILPTGYQFLDIDENAFYLDLENERPVSGDAIVRDHYLAKRDHTYGPLFKGWQIGEKAAALFGRDDGSAFSARSAGIASTSTCGRASESSTAGTTAASSPPTTAKPAGTAVTGVTRCGSTNPNSHAERFTEDARPSHGRRNRLPDEDALCGLWRPGSGDFSHGRQLGRTSGGDLLERQRLARGME